MIHKFTALGEKIVLDVASGAVHLLDDVSYLILDFMSKNGFDRRAALYEAKKQGFTEQQVDEAYGELLALKEEGMLFSNDEYEALAQIPKQSVIKALCLHICHDCNLRCEYCFAGTGDFKGARSMMSAETGKKAIDFVIKNSQNRKNIEIDYFGGEPLMNFEVVKEITEYAKAQGEKHGKNFRFTITTNGLLLNEDIKAYINENMSNVVLSIDGRKEVNDKMRHRIDGSGSYDSILPKFLDLAEIAKSG